ncbi:hypothetical protein JCM17960_04890 [Magnetospira thiophila]
MTIAIVALGLVLPMASCGPRPPTDSFGSDLDANCKPQDPIDKLSALLSPKKFWLAREFELRAFIKAGEANIANSKNLLDDNRTRKNEYRGIAMEAAQKEGYKGAALKKFVEDYMREYEQMAVSSKRAIEQEKVELNWAMNCLKAVERQVVTLRVTPEDREAATPPSKRKLKLTLDDLRGMGGLSVDQAKKLAKETTLTRRDMATFLREQRNPRIPGDVQDDILKAFEN